MGVKNYLATGSGLIQFKGVFIYKLLRENPMYFPLNSSQYLFLSKTIEKDISSYFYCEDNVIPITNQLTEIHLQIMAEVYKEGSLWRDVIEKRYPTEAAQYLISLGLLVGNADYLMQPPFVNSFPRLSTINLLCENTNELFKNFNQAISSQHSYLKMLPDPVIEENFRKNIETTIEYLQSLLAASLEKQHNDDMMDLLIAVSLKPEIQQQHLPATSTDTPTTGEQLWKNLLFFSDTGPSFNPTTPDQQNHVP